MEFTYLEPFQTTGRLAVTCLETYYISEGLFATPDLLTNAKTIRLLVIQLIDSPANSRTKPTCSRPRTHFSRPGRNGKTPKPGGTASRPRLDALECGPNLRG